MARKWASVGMCRDYTVALQGRRKGRALALPWSLFPVLWCSQRMRCPQLGGAVFAFTATAATGRDIDAVLAEQVFEADDPAVTLRRGNVEVIRIRQTVLL